jgi:diaminopimelate epimerase
VTEFWRLSGGGNDFLALVEPEDPPRAAQIRAWCTRGSSLGADGIFLLHRGEAVRMDYFNADGGRAELCLNGTRCAGQLAFHLGWATQTVRIATSAGEMVARRVSTERVAVEVPMPDATPQALALDVQGHRLVGWRLRVGVPHLVIPWPDGLERCPVAELGPPLRRHPQVGPPGANVDFVRFASRHALEIRTFERGVEAETLACGTGVLAAVACGVATGELTLPVAAQTLGGYVLEVAGPKEPGRSQSWTLTGDARVLAHGTVFAAAESVPAPPPWR